MLFISVLAAWRVLTSAARRHSKVSFADVQLRDILRIIHEKHAVYVLCLRNCLTVEGLYQRNGTSVTLQVHGTRDVLPLG